MLFNSLSFIIFFPIVTLLYFLGTPPSKESTGNRWVILLIASCIFYMWFIPQYLLILFLTIIVDYYAGILIEDSQGKKRKLYLNISIISTCLILFIFKYFNFFNTNFKLIAEQLGLHYPVEFINIILPVGLSFHTFQSLSYVIEVYRGHQKAERHFGIYSLYVMFYPQLVAGPIERPQNLLWQFRENFDFDYKRVSNGLKLMAWGLFKKVVIADRLSVLVDYTYRTPESYDGLAHIISTVFFAFQIYCDFSGYSDVAIGSAQVMGFKLMDNFNRPYFSKTISEFWKRWHISLSTWFKDYLYISMGGNKCSKWRWQYNLFVTFFISGLWHGASWTYVAWGSLNGFYLVFANLTHDFRKKLRLKIFTQSSTVLKYYRILVTFSLICFSWIFFRATSIEKALTVIQKLPTGWGIFYQNLMSKGLAALSVESIFNGKVPLTNIWLITSFILIGFLVFIHALQRHSKIRHMLSEKPWWIRWPVYYVIVGSIVFMGVYGENQFIYFQF